MKDGRTHLAHKAERVDLDSGALVAVTLSGAEQGDTATLSEAGIAVAEQMGREAQLRSYEKPRSTLVAPRISYSHQGTSTTPDAFVI